MITNYIKIAFRNLWRNKTFSAINLLGLSMGITAFTLIMLWVKSEFEYDAHYSEKDNIAAVMVNQSFDNGEIQTYAATPYPLAEAYTKDLQDVKFATTTSWGDQLQFTVEDNTFTEYGLYVSPSFLDVFSTEIIKGDRNTILKKPNTIVLTEMLAQKYFGEENPIGKTIKIGETQTYEVVGVTKDSYKNATIRYNYLIPIENYFITFPFASRGWDNNNFRTYIRLKPSGDMSYVENMTKTFLNKYTDKQATSTMFLWKMNDWYLRGEFKDGKVSGGRIKYVKLFALSAFIIFLLACINFMNLSTAAASHRTKEIGIRKSIGANRLALIQQFLGESLLTACMSGIIALLLLVVLLPSFNMMFNKNLVLAFDQPINVAVYLSIVLLSGLLAGIYPAFILSSLDSVKAIKKQIGIGGVSNSLVRKGLVVGQFAITIILITCSMIISKQMNYLQEKDLGYNKDNLIWFSNNIPPNKVDAAMEEISKVKGVVSSALSSMTFTNSNNRGHKVSWPGKNEGQDVFFNFVAGNYSLPQTMGLDIVEGRSFSKEIATDTSSYLINEEAVRKMNLKNPVGETIETESGKGTIVGVIKDYHFESLHYPIGPVIMSCRPDWTWLMYIKLDGANNKEAISAIKTIYQTFAPNYLFEYNYQEEQPEWFYRSEKQTAILTKWFSFLAIFLSCLGLLGLSIYTVARREKEIGIRKVIGASASQIVYLITSQFIGLILIAVVISILPTYYFSTNWLESFAYYTPTTLVNYLVGPILAMLLAMFSISSNVIKAAISKPIDTLKSE